MERLPGVEVPVKQALSADHPPGLVAVFDYNSLLTILERFHSFEQARQKLDHLFHLSWRHERKTSQQSYKSFHNQWSKLRVPHRQYFRLLLSQRRRLRKDIGNGGFPRSSH